MSKQKKNTQKVTKKELSAKVKPATPKSSKAQTWPELSIYKISRLALLVAALVAIALAFIQYGQSVPYGFVLDDKIVVSENNFVKQGFAGIDDLLLSEGFTGYFNEQKDLIPGARYRPLSLITFAIEYEIFGGLNSSMNHLFNILLYGLCGWLVFIGLARLYPVGKNWWFSIPFLVLILWCSHAVHTEVVANIKSRDEIMSLIFSMLALICSIDYFKKGKTIYLVGAAFSFFLGLMSKETTLTFLAIIPVAIYFFRRPDKKKMVLVIASLLIPLVIYLGIRYTAIGYLLSSIEVTDVMNNPFVGMSFSERMATIFYTLLKYLGLSFLPYPLTHDYYPFQIPRAGWFNPVVLTSLIIHGAMAIYMVLNFRNRKKWVFPLFFYIASLSIASNLVINVGTTMNERFIFTPTVGTCILMVLGIQWLVKKFNLNKLITPIAVGLISILYLTISINRTEVWSSPLKLNEAGANVSTNSARAQSFMATALYNEAIKETDRETKLDMLRQAETFAKKAINIFPDYKNANLMLAGISGEKHKIDRQLGPLLEDFTIAASNRPEISFIHEYIDYISDRHGDENAMIDFFYQVGYENLAVKQKRYDWAVKFLTYAYNMQPDNPKITFAISKSYRGLGNEEQADAFLSETLTRDPSYHNK